MTLWIRIIALWTCCLVLLGGVAAGVFWVVGHHVREMRTFQPVEAEIIHAGVGDGPGRGANYYPLINFKYTFNGQTYRGGEYKTTGWKSDAKRGPQGIVDRYPVGSMHTAWVNPANPKTAVLVREMNWIALGLLIAASVIPIGMLVYFHCHELRRTKASASVYR